MRGLGDPGPVAEQLGGGFASVRLLEGRLDPCLCAEVRGQSSWSSFLQTSWFTLSVPVPANDRTLASDRSSTAVSARSQASRAIRFSASWKRVAVIDARRLGATFDVIQHFRDVVARDACGSHPRGRGAPQVVSPEVDAERLCDCCWRLFGAIAQRCAAADEDKLGGLVVRLALVLVVGLLRLQDGLIGLSRLDDGLDAFDERDAVRFAVFRIGAREWSTSPRPGPRRPTSSGRASPPRWPVSRRTFSSAASAGLTGHNGSSFCPWTPCGRARAVPLVVGKCSSSAPEVGGSHRRLARVPASLPRAGLAMRAAGLASIHPGPRRS